MPGPLLRIATISASFPAFMNPAPFFPPPLTKRNNDLVEFMDQPDCDPVRLQNTYRQFHLVNRLLSDWRTLYTSRIRPVLMPGRTNTLLDVGCGGGDITRALFRWAIMDGFRVDVTGVDPDSRAMTYIRARSGERVQADDCSLRFEQRATGDLLRAAQRFDIVVCNHVLHHIPSEQTAAFLHDLSTLSERRVICSDIRRSRTGYLLFSATTGLFFRDSFIRPDGLISIRRSYTHAELEALATVGWKVRAIFPFRLIAQYDHTA